MGLEAHGLHTAFPRERVLEMLVLTSLQRTKSLLKATNTITRTQPLPFLWVLVEEQLMKVRQQYCVYSRVFIKILYISDYRYNYRTMESNEETSRVINTPLINR